MLTDIWQKLNHLTYTWQNIQSCVSRPSQEERIARKGNHMWFNDSLKSGTHRHHQTLGLVTGERRINLHPENLSLPLLVAQVMLQVLFSRVRVTVRKQIEDYQMSHSGQILRSCWL